MIGKDKGVINKKHYSTLKDGTTIRYSSRPATCKMGTLDAFPGAKARPGRECDYLPPYSAEVKNECGLYFLSRQAPSWCIVGQLHL
jgi:hypothetical protein